VVPLARAAVLHVAVPPSLELCRRDCSPRAVNPRRRRPGRSPEGSPTACRRFGAGSAAKGAPQRRLAVAPPLAGAAPPRLPCRRSFPRRCRAYRSKEPLPVKGAPTGQPRRLRSTAQIVSTPRSKEPLPVNPAALNPSRWILIQWTRSIPIALTARFCT
jgi:hypothetical protein